MGFDEVAVEDGECCNEGKGTRRGQREIEGAVGGGIDSSGEVMILR